MEVYKEQMLNSNSYHTVIRPICPAGVHIAN